MHNVDVLVSPHSLAKQLKQMACALCGVTTEHPEAVRCNNRGVVTLFETPLDSGGNALVLSLVTTAEKLEQQVDPESGQKE